VQLQITTCPKLDNFSIKQTHGFSRFWGIPQFEGNPPWGYSSHRTGRTIELLGAFDHCMGGSGLGLLLNSTKETDAASHVV